MRFSSARQVVTARFDPRKANGLGLTVAVLLTLAFFWGFIFLARGVVDTSSLISVDGWVWLHMATMRSPAATRLFWGATVLGDTPSMAALVLLAGVLLLAWGRSTYAALVAGSVTLAWGFESLAKAVVHRARPPLGALVRLPGNFSFPSGHAVISLVLCGTLAFLVLRSVRSKILRAVLVAVAVVVVLLVGFSRIYLGVHWTTDVIGSWLLGAAWLSASLGTYLVYARTGRRLRESPPWGGPRTRIILSVILAVAALVVVIVDGHFDPLLGKGALSGFHQVLALSR
jgi:membrane-associated phospholipid phosphatase